MPVPVGRDRLPREVVAEHQRARVLDAAPEVFAEHGFEGTTVDQIVSAAGIGVGSFYSLFDGKLGCFLAAYDRVVAAGRERLLAAPTPGDPWPDRLAVSLRALLELVEEQPAAARIALVEVHTAGPEALARHERNIEEGARLLRGGRRYSALAGELPATLEFAIVGGLTWYLQQRLASGTLTDAPSLLPEVLEIVAEPYLGAAETSRLASRYAPAANRES